MQDPVKKNSATRQNNLPSHEQRSMFQMSQPTGGFATAHSSVTRQQQDIQQNATLPSGPSFVVHNRGVDHGQQVSSYQRINQRTPVRSRQMDEEPDEQSFFNEEPSNAFGDSGYSDLFAYPGNRFSNSEHQPMARNQRTPVHSRQMGEEPDELSFFDEEPSNASGNSRYIELSGFPGKQFPGPEQPTAPNPKNQSNRRLSGSSRDLPTSANPTSNYTFARPNITRSVSRSQIPIPRDAHGGLVNLGLKCFMNSSLQLLASSPVFCNVVLDHTPIYQVHRALHDMILNLISGDGPLEPTEFVGILKHVSLRGTNFEVGEHDPHEFILALIDYISSVECGEIGLPFILTCRQRIYCTEPNCGQSRYMNCADMKSMEIHLLDEINSVQEAVTAFPMPCKWTSKLPEGFLHEQSLLEQWSILLPPVLLLIHFKRYSSNGTKNSKLLVVEDSINCGSQTYRLVGFTVHIGARVNYGHIVAYVAKGENMILYNDETVSAEKRQDKYEVGVVLYEKC